MMVAPFSGRHTVLCGKPVFHLLYGCICVDILVVTSGNEYLSCYGEQVVEHEALHVAGFVRH